MGVAGLLVAAVLAVVAMAASPRLHEEAHEDADHADHECAVTLFASGSAADQVEAPPVLPIVVRLCVETLRVEGEGVMRSTRADGRIRDRAPPVDAV